MLPRLLVPTATLAASVAALQLIDALFLDRPTPPVTYLMVPLAVGAAAVILIGAIEVILRRLRPVRSLSWLPATFGVFWLVFHAAIWVTRQWNGDPRPTYGWFVDLGWLHLVTTSLFVSSGLLWWSYLPAPGRPLPEVFE